MKVMSLEEYKNLRAELFRILCRIADGTFVPEDFTRRDEVLDKLLSTGHFTLDAAEQLSMIATMTSDRKWPTHNGF